MFITKKHLSRRTFLQGAGVTKVPASVYTEPARFEAEQARLLLPVRTRPGRYTFAHALVRSTLYEEISTTRRLRLHRRVGQALEGRGADRRADELAHHFCECAGLGDMDRAVKYGSRAAERAVERLAYEEAAGWNERLLAALDPDDVDHALRAALNVELGKARWASGDRDMAKKAFADAMASARIIRDAELFGQSSRQALLLLRLRQGRRPDHVRARDRAARLRAGRRVARGALPRDTRVRGVVAGARRRAQPP